MILYVMNREYFHNDKIQTNFLAKRLINATLASKDNDVYNSKNWKKNRNGREMEIYFHFIVIFT